MKKGMKLFLAMLFAGLGLAQAQDDLYDPVNGTRMLYKVNLETNDESLGSVVGSGAYAYGSTVRIDAWPESGSDFYAWSDGVEGRSRYITVRGDTTIGAFFVKTHPIEFVSNFIAETFDKTTRKISERVVKRDTIRMDIMEGEIPDVPKAYAAFNCNDTLSLSPEDKKEMYYECSWDREFAPVTENTRYVFTRKAGLVLYNTVFYFENGEEKTEVYREQRPYNERPLKYPDVACPEETDEYNFECEWQRTPFKLYADYEDSYVVKKIRMYNFDITMNDSAGGVVIGSGRYREGEHVWVVAERKEGYEFMGWSDGSKELARNIVATKNITLKALFKKIRTIKFIKHIVELGYDAKKRISTVKHYDDYEIKKKFLDHDMASLSSDREIFCYDGDSSFNKKWEVSCSWDRDFEVVSQDTFYVLTEVRTPKWFSIVFNYDAGEDGKKTVADSLPYNTAPVPPEDFVCPTSDAEFTYTCTWDKDIRVVAGDETYTLRVTKSKNKYYVAIQPNNFKMGMIFLWGNTIEEKYSNYTEYEYGTVFKASALAIPGYVFKGWFDGDTTVVRTFVVRDTIDVVAFFEPEESSKEELEGGAPGIAAGAKGSLDIEVTGAKVGALYHVMDLQGRTLLKGRVGSPNFGLTVPRTGSYVLRIGNYSKKVILR